MTVLDSVIVWLKSFKPEEHLKMQSINTDILAARVNSFCLMKEPTVIKKTSISGKVTVTEHYTLSALLASFENGERVSNNEWGELLEKWVFEQNKIQNFPAIPNASVKEVKVSTPFFRGNTLENESIYQMTISIKYVKE